MKNIRKSFRRFINNEAGVGAVEKVAMLAVASIILLGMLKFTNGVLMVQTKENVKRSMDFKIDGSGGGADLNADSDEHAI